MSKARPEGLGAEDQSDIEEIAGEVQKKKKKKIIKKIIKKKNPDGTDAPSQVIIIQKDSNTNVSNNPMDSYGLTEQNGYVQRPVNNTLSKQSSNTTLNPAASQAETNAYSESTSELPN
jgi:hypothetical protein